MKKICVFLLILIVSDVRGQDVEVIRYQKLLEILENGQGSDIEVYNFWATWCRPCVKEIPYFEEINNRYENVDVILISFDDVEKLESRVKPFIRNKKLKSRVYLIDETDYNAFIDKVDSQWSGAIPATIIIDRRNGKRFFYEKEFEREELMELIKQLNP
ncbi:MAG: redoxin domain-containing protein [Cyclobacteriaceae bacterium]|nr:redoxin domain-containing protein [Cyclobacteriaceae bacterium]